MLSIAIPIYNFNVTELVSALNVEIQQKQLPVEIILIDDCSDAMFRTINQQYDIQFTYIQLEENVGRSKIRNLFLQYAQYEYLLFLDCDSLVIKSNFIETYLNAIQKTHSQVICGGRTYLSKKVNRNHRLSWRYGREQESKTAIERQLYPNRSFMTNNFVISKSLLKQIPFDERIASYGHEDTLLGFHLEQKSISVYHIDNEILNNDIETNAIFLKKTESAMKNLKFILEITDDKPAFIKTVKLLTYHKKLSANPLLRWSVIIAFYLLNPIIRWFLKKGYVSLTAFSFYKLGFFLRYNLCNFEV